MDTNHHTAKRLACRALRGRRRLLRTGWAISAPFRRKIGFNLAERLRSTLRLSQREAAHLDREIDFYDKLTMLEWLALRVRSVPQLVDDCAHIEIDDPDVFVRAGASGKPVILAPIHMGNYVICLAHLMHRFFPARPMLILRARDDNPDDTAVMKRIQEIGIDMRFLKVAEKQDYVEAVRFARKGAVIVYFVDLPESYGGPIDITLFGRPARIALGLDSLARLCEASVIPIATIAAQTGDLIRVGQPFEVMSGGPQQRERVADSVRDHIEQSILAAPAQWHMWSRLDEFLTPEAPYALEAAQ